MAMTRILIATSIFLLAACGGEETADQAQPTTTAKRDCNLKMGWEPRAPYQFERNGEITGIDVQILQQAADSIECDVSFVKNSWSELLTDLENGDVDVLAGATVTPGREAYATFSEPYRSESFTLFIRSSNSYNGNTLSGFLSRSQKIGVTNDYFYGKEVYQLMNHPQYSNLFVNSGSGAQSFYNILYSEIDGVLADPVEGHYILEHKGLTNKIKASNVHIASDSVAYMFSKETLKDEKLANLQAAIKDMVANDQIQPIIAKF